MNYQPFLIAPFKTGLDTDLEPWLLPQDAFEKIENAHIRHGIVEKRKGFSKLADIVHNDGANWDVTNITQADPGVVTVTSVAGLSNGDEIELRNVSGMIEVNGQRYLIAGIAGATFQLTDLDGTNVDTTGFTAYTGNGEVYLIPKLRVMGLQRYIDAQNVKQLLAFDTERASIYNSANARFDLLDNADIFTSSDTDFIWSDNWSSTASSAAVLFNRMYFTNGKSNGGGATDGIRFYDATVSTTTTTQFNPLINSAVEIRGCKLIYAYKGRLLLLNTFEDARHYPQRVRWSQVNNPSIATAWDDGTPGKGGFLDAPTSEHIISAQFVQDILVVMFTSSIWALKPLTNPALPFLWERINSFRACDGKMASTGFDRYLVGAGIRGITATDGVETRRIDDRIDLFVKDEINNDEFDKTFMARSFGERRMWMLYASSEDSDPNNALIYDEESSAFSTYGISMNVLGYGGVNKDSQLDDFTDAAAEAGDLPLTLDVASDSQLDSFFWDKGDETFLGGDRSGGIHLLENDGDDEGSDITMELQSAAWNPFTQEGAESQMGYIDLFIETHPTTEFEIFFKKDNEFDDYSSTTMNCLPRLKEVSLVVDILKKSPATDGVTVSAPDHGLSTGDEIYLYVVSGMDGINGGSYTITVIDGNSFDIDIDSTNFSAYTTGGVVTLLPYRFEKVWKRIYAGGIGYQHKVRIKTTGSDKPFKIHAFMPWFRKKGRRLI